MAVVWRSARSAPDRSALERRSPRDRALSFRCRTHDEQWSSALVPPRLRSPLAHSEFQRVSTLARPPRLRASPAGMAPPRRELDLVVSAPRTLIVAARWTLMSALTRLLEAPPPRSSRKRP